MTGFTRAEVMQRSSTTDFLHGPMTSQQAVNLIRDALTKGFEKHFEILYYRKTGKNPLWKCEDYVKNLLLKNTKSLYKIFFGHDSCLWEAK